MYYRCKFCDQPIIRNDMCSEHWQEDYEELKARVKKLEETCAGHKAIFYNSDGEYECRECGDILSDLI